MHFGLLLALLQQPVAPAPSNPIVRVEITPAAGELQIGQSLRLTARALDASGAPVANARSATSWVRTTVTWIPPGS